ncbi:succinate--CoA ligase [GDP-forming] subunit beta, mitochondrial isoform X1 [Silurus asotus]|uniref:succinate--CoA ligase (GDP-forming) n=1 Tax=Silurus asotus TaxID=30991 RepID=A0AAD5F893_SILAS|nr:succinate--CoA ligase [GDP-forming] subunit beta, mitochondrial isoform X1 [Silurus asotus]
MPTDGSTGLHAQSEGALAFIRHRELYSWCYSDHVPTLTPSSFSHVAPVQRPFLKTGVTRKFLVNKGVKPVDIYRRLQAQYIDEMLIRRVSKQAIEQIENSTRMLIDTRLATLLHAIHGCCNGCRELLQKLFPHKSVQVFCLLNCFSPRAPPPPPPPRSARLLRDRQGRTTLGQIETQAKHAAAAVDAKEIVLKAQILAGGRGKGVFDSGLKGGVHLTKDPAVVQELANKMLGFSLTTKQTPKEGVKVNTVMVAEALDISRETYFAILMDRAFNGPVMVGSPQGGVDIEEVAAKTPELIYKEVIDIFEGVRDDQALRMAANLGFKGPLERQAADQIKKLYDLFLKVDATQVEVNPLGETPEGQVVCFDAKINFDDNAEFRQKNVFAMDNTAESDPTETEAAKYDLKYIGLDGNIACFVNGAGLAMATCDIIDLHGGKPANFLDLGGGVKENQVYVAFKLLTADPKRGSSAEAERRGLIRDRRSENDEF